MAIAKIVGVEPVNYNRKTDGSPVNGITLYFEYKVSVIWGVKCAEHFISSDKSLYKQFVPFKDDPKALLGKEFEFQRNERGFIEDLVLKK